jgi:1-phosphofructokinase family hexose kinase
MILAITPNAAVDRTLTVPPFEPGQVTRATETLVAAGGKGINVARAVYVFGDRAVCAGLLGGYSGKQIEALAKAEGLTGAWTWMAGESRTCTIVISSGSGDATVFNEPGPTITTEDWINLRADVAGQAAAAGRPAGADYVCLCGSLPPGTPPEAPGDLVQDVRRTGAPIWVDTSKASLRASLTARPSGLKVNAVEAGDVLGITIDSLSSAFEAADQLRQMDIETVVLTLGKQGAILISGAGRWWAKPPDLEIVSSVGSGDVFLAGLVTGLAAGASPADALSRAVAAGAANAMQPGGGSFSLTDFERLLSQVVVRRY